MTNTQRDKGAWEIEKVIFTGNVCYPFHVVGINHYETDRGKRGWISWAIPTLWSNDAYDLSGAVFEGLSNLSD